ncbi:unnamed protein product [Calicophoron daubneyi]|uniref:Tektin n=1 Tax=Calicophoron daubneyi TaxID=300641 RepID=A0AAV2T3S6_CALDB
MELMMRQFGDNRLGLSASADNLPSMMNSTVYSSNFKNPYATRLFDWNSEKNRLALTSRQRSVVAPWRPSTYNTSSRILSYGMGCSSPLNNLTGEMAKLRELEGIRVPAVYSAARNALYTRYTPADWSNRHTICISSSDEAQKRGEQARIEATRLGLESDDRIRRAREEVNKKLGQRISDIQFLKANLQEETDLLVDEMNRLVQSKRAAEKTLAETENPLHITQECLYRREKRMSTELVHDEPEGKLLTEIDVTKDCQDKLKQMVNTATAQLSICRAVQHEIEKDSSDKFQALELDNLAQQLNTSSAGLALHDGVEKVEQWMSVPEKWLSFTAANLKRSQTERAASRKLREDIERCLSSTTMRMRESWAMSSSALAQRAQEVAEARNQLQVQLVKVNQEMFDLEQNNDYVKRCITEKQGPLQLAQTRLDLRGRRPNVELCRDEPHTRIIAEVAELEETIGQLIHQLAANQTAYQNLLKIRGHLETDLSQKSNSLFIDREQCLGLRKTFPMTPAVIVPA